MSTGQGMPRIASNRQRPEEARRDPPWGLEREHGATNTLMSDLWASGLF